MNKFIRPVRSSVNRAEARTFQSLVVEGIYLLGSPIVVSSISCFFLTKWKQNGRKSINSMSLLLNALPSDWIALKVQRRNGIRTKTSFTLFSFSYFQQESEVVETRLTDRLAFGTFRRSIDWIGFQRPLKITDTFPWHTAFSTAFHRNLSRSSLTFIDVFLWFRTQFWLIHSVMPTLNGNMYIECPSIPLIWLNRAHECRACRAEDVKGSPFIL